MSLLTKRILEFGVLRSNYVVVSVKLSVKQ